MARRGTSLEPVRGMRVLASVLTAALAQACVAPAAPMPPAPAARVATSSQLDPCPAAESECNGGTGDLRTLGIGLAALVAFAGAIVLVHALRSH
ncbi:MAG: hypothetical protein ACTHU0_14105 [Kofleriaceae bacterium]